MPLFESCGSRLLKVAEVVPSAEEETMACFGVKNLVASVEWMVRMRAGIEVPEEMPDLGSMPP